MTVNDTVIPCYPSMTMLQSFMTVNDTVIPCYPSTTMLQSFMTESDTVMPLPLYDNGETTNMYLNNLFLVKHDFNYDR